MCDSLISRIAAVVVAMAVSMVWTPLRPIDDTDSSKSDLCLLALDVVDAVVVVVRLHLRLFCVEASCNLIELAALEAALTRFVCSVFVVVVVVLVAVGLILF